MEFYQTNIGSIDANIESCLTYWIDKFETTIIIEALVRSLSAQKPISYANKILDSWHRQGVTKLKDIQHIDEYYKNKKR